MRVLIVPNSYPPVLGGLQTVAHTLATHLLDQGHHVRVVTNRYPRTLPVAETLEQIHVNRWLFLQPTKEQLRQKRPDLFFASTFYYPYTLLRFHRLMSQYQPDVVNVHFPDAQTPFILSLRRHFQFRLVVSLHGHEIERWQTPPITGNLRQLRNILLEADVVTACSRYLLDQAIKLMPEIQEKGKVIHNGIDPARFQDRTPYPHPRPYALAYGRLTHRKGFDLLLEAWATTTANDRMDLLIAGDGEEKEFLISKAQKLGLAGNIHFIGRVLSNQIVQLLNGCRFVVVPSRQESFGIVALEAMAAGKPLVASDVGGLAELVSDAECASWHRLTAPTPETLAAAINDVFQNTSKDIIARNPSLFQDYSWATVSHRYERVLKSERA